MTYATATALLTRFDATEIAQRVDRGLPRLVTGQMLAAVAAAANMDAYTTEEAARAAVGMTVVSRALQDADDTINSYLSGRYTLPLAPVPAVLERVACELARYFLYDDQVTDVIKERYTANLKWLYEVAKGAVSLGADAASGVQPVSSAGAELVGTGTVWKRADSTAFL